MTGFDDEMLMRRADGELSPERAAEVDAAAAKDPVLAGRLAAFRRARTAAREAFPIGPDARDADLARLIAGGEPRSPGWIGRLKAAFAPGQAPLWGGLGRPVSSVDWRSAGWACILRRTGLRSSRAGRSPTPA